MTNVIDWILDLFRDPIRAHEFVTDPARAMAAANVSNVTAAQMQAVAATVAPAAVLNGGGDPVYGLQQAVAQTHGIAFVPQRQTDLLSNNDMLSHNDTRLLSPETTVANHAGEDQQQGVGNFDLDFGDITFGDKTTNTATDGGVVNTGQAGDIHTTNVEGDGNVVGDHNDNVNTGNVHTGNNSPVIIGEDNGARVDDNHVSSGGDVIDNNHGTVIKDVDASGGSGGHGGGLLGGSGGSGGGGGIIVDTHSTSSVDSHQTTVGDVGGDVAAPISGGLHTDDHATTTVDNSVDSSVHDNVHDSSVHSSNTTVDNSVDNHSIHAGVGLF
jgi:hypothetical protein